MELRRWRTSSPFVGAVAGLVTAAATHLFGSDLGPGMVGAIGLHRLFEASPAVGYVAFAVGGALVGLLFQGFEGRDDRDGRR